MPVSPDPCLPMVRHELLREAPPGPDDDVRFAESLAEAMIGAYTVEGDVVLDPFAGFGTTAVVARRMNRRVIAVELLPERANVIRDRVGDAAHVITGDARSLTSLVAGPIDLCLTSPPYMTSSGHPENPLTGYRTLDGDYGTYLDEIESVARQVLGLLRPFGHLVLNVADIENEGAVTPLGRDVSERVIRHVELVRWLPICWDERPSGILDDRCLVFRKGRTRMTRRQSIGTPHSEG